MKKRNNITRYLVIGLLFCCCVGCTTSNRFAKRKYFQGHFFDESERYARANTKTDNNEKKLADATEFFTNQPTIGATDVTANIVSVPVSKCKAVQKEISSHQRLIFTPSYYKKQTIIRAPPPGADLQIASKNASLFGTLALVFNLLPYLLIFLLSLDGGLLLSLLISMILSITFSIIALIYARGVVKNSEASKEQIKMAKRGKAMAIACLVVWVVFLIALVSIISEVR
jgi:hypothetical protein